MRYTITEPTATRAILCSLSALHAEMDADAPSVPAFLLAHAAPMLKMSEPRETMLAGECFSNAMAYAQRYGMLYAEGYASAFGLPMHHAWAIDPDTWSVHDPTWESMHTDRCVYEYLGIVMYPCDVLPHLVKKGHYGLFTVSNANEGDHVMRILRGDESLLLVDGGDS